MLLALPPRNQQLLNMHIDFVGRTRKDGICVMGRPLPCPSLMEPVRGRSKPITNLEARVSFWCRPSICAYTSKSYHSLFLDRFEARKAIGFFSEVDTVVSHNAFIEASFSLSALATQILRSMCCFGGLGHRRQRTVETDASRSSRTVLSRGDARKYRDHCHGAWKPPAQALR